MNIGVFQTVMFVLRQKLEILIIFLDVKTFVCLITQEIVLCDAKICFCT